MIRRLAADRRGASGVLVAGGLPMLLGFAAFAVDLGAVQLDARRLQGVADAAALAAAADPINARAAAQGVVDTANWPRPVTILVTPGRYVREGGREPGARFMAGGERPDAAQVRLTTDSPAYLIRALGISATTITRDATAARQRFASIEIGSRLASLQGGVLNAYLSALTGSDVSLSVMDYRALADADVDLFGYLDAVRTRAAVRGPTYGDTLAANVATGTLLDAIADAAGAGAAAAIRRLSQQSAGSVTLGALVDAGPLAGQAGGGRGVARMSALALATALIQAGSAKRQVTLDLGASVPSLASAEVTLAIGDRPARATWIAIGDDGTPIVRTAQTRLLAEVTLAPAPIAGIGAPVAIRAPLFVELASAEARVAKIDCTRGGVRGVTAEARLSPGQAAIASVERAGLDDFGTPPAFAPATLLSVPLISVQGQARIDLGAAEAWQPLRFDQPAIEEGAMRSVASSQPTASIARSLLSNLSLTARIAGLPVPADAAGRSVGQALGLVAPALDTLIALATGTLGVKVGEADVRVTGMRCGTPVLVA